MPVIIDDGNELANRFTGKDKIGIVLGALNGVECCPLCTNFFSFFLNEAKNNVEGVFMKRKWGAKRMKRMIRK